MLQIPRHGEGKGERVKEKEAATLGAPRAASPWGPQGGTQNSRALGPRLGKDRLVLLVFALATYAIVLVAPYAVTDDYKLVYDLERGSSFLPVGIAGGRPVSAFVLVLLFERVRFLADYGWVRLLGVVGAGLMAAEIASALVRAGWSRRYALVVGALAITLPPIQCVTSWASTSPYALGGVLSAWGYRTSHRGSLSRSWKGALGWTLVGAFLVAVSALDYQPMAPIFLLFWAIDLLAAHGAVRETWRMQVLRLGSFGLGMALALVGFRVGVALYPQAISTTRAALVTQPDALVRKLQWFWEGPLRNACTFWSLNQKARTVPWVGLLLAAGLLLRWTPRGVLFRFVGPLVAAAAIVGSYAPNLVTSESWGAYRTQVALGPTVFVLCAMSVGFLGRWVQGIWGRRWPGGELALRSVVAGGLLLAPILSGLVALRTVHTYYVAPQETEIRWVRSQLRRLTVGIMPRVVGVVGCPWADVAFASPHAYYDEFGVATCAQSWALEGLVHRVAEDWLHREPPFQIRAGWADVTISMEQLGELR